MQYLKNSSVEYFDALAKVVGKYLNYIASIVASIVSDGRPRHHRSTPWYFITKCHMWERFPLVFCDAKTSKKPAMRYEGSLSGCCQENDVKKKWLRFGFTSCLQEKKPFLNVRKSPTQYPRERLKKTIWP